MLAGKFEILCYQNPTRSIVHMIETENSGPQFLPRLEKRSLCVQCSNLFGATQMTDFHLASLRALMNMAY